MMWCDYSFQKLDGSLNEGVDEYMDVMNKITPA